MTEYIEVLKPRPYEMVRLKEGFRYVSNIVRPTAVSFRGTGNEELAVIRDGVFRCVVDPTDKNTLEFIQAVNSLLESAGHPALTKIEPLAEE